MVERTETSAGWPARALRAALLWSCCAAPLAGQPAEARPWRLGVFFWHPSPNDLVALEGIREALRERGRPHRLVVRQARADRDRAVALLAELRAEPVDLLFAMGTQAALLAKEHVPSIPVVFTAVTHPVESAVVPSWEGSGTNLAGNSNWIEPATVLRVFRLAVPSLTRLGVLRSTASSVVSAAEVRGMRRRLREPGAAPVELVEEVVERVDGIAAAVGRLVGAGVQAIWIPIDFLVYQNIDIVLDAVHPHGIPLVSSSMKGARSGAVAGVLVDYAMLGKRAVAIALDVLERGAAPGRIPVGTMKGYRVVVNLAAARRCGYDLPLSLLALADRILKDGDSDGARRERQK